MAMNRIALFFLMGSLFCFAPLFAETDFSVETIARAISWIKPGLEERKINIYAKAISKAARKYRVDPLTLVAIAHQESSFRENLPMGKAGEVGLLQIRRDWIHNPRFRKEFKNAKEQDLRNSDKAFTYAAWILRDLKRTSRGARKLPYWTFYNARKFEMRAKYYVRVTRHLSAIQNKKERYKLLAVAKSEKQMEPIQRIISETPQLSAPQVQPRDLLNQINWYQKALNLFQEQEG